jgi:hypothetical protein
VVADEGAVRDGGDVLAVVLVDFVGAVLVRVLLTK